MVMGQQDGGELQFQPLQCCGDGSRIAGIDDDGPAAVMGQPEIVVVEGRDGYEAQLGVPTGGRERDYSRAPCSAR